jgi:RNA polymerase sigma-70 factor (ECF subfamily)
MPEDPTTTAAATTATTAAAVAAVAVEQAYRDHWTRVLALLTGQVRSLDLAEESLQEAFALAVDRWARDGVPGNPPAWLLTTARWRALDRLRSDEAAQRRLPRLVTDVDDGPGPDEQALALAEPSLFPDERLRLIFTCCHPALAPEARVALTLRYVGGLTTPEIARLFLAKEATIAARLTRAKRKLTAAGIPYRVPAAADVAERLDGVLTVLYLVFTEGYAATAGDRLHRAETAAEALRLAGMLSELLPEAPEVTALRSLMLLHHARRDARLDAAGRLVRLPDQDRSRWHHDEIDEGLRRLDDARRQAARTSGHGSDGDGPYLLQAAIAAEHARAPQADLTDWPAIADLYGRLERRTGSAVVRLNRAVAVAEAGDPAAALALLDGLDRPLARSHRLPATRAELLRRLDRPAEAAAAYDRALELVDNVVERRHLQDQRDALPPLPG